MTHTAIVILNWNGKHHLQRFLPTIAEHTPEWAEIFVADNGSTDGSAEYVKEHFSSINIIQLDRNYGFAGGYNRALAQIEADYYILLNSDVETTQGWVEPLVEMLDKNPNIAAVAPKILSLNERDKFEYAGAAGGYIDILGYPFCRGRILSTIECDKGQYNSAREVFWASGAAYCCRAELFHKMGGFDERFFAHMEEIDLCWRLQLSGHKIFVEPKSQIYHLGGGTMPNESPNKLYLNYRNNLSMLFRCAPSWQRCLVAVIRPATDMLSALIYILKREPMLAKATIRAYCDFIRLHKVLAAQRKQIRGAATAESSQIYRGSIVLQYMMGKRTFSKIKI
jgi:GT2 family glycosyltransferase